MSKMQEQTGRNNTAREWSSSELALVREHASLGAAALAAMLGRSEASIRAFANRHRISLRRAGESRGLLLGQPRGVRWLEQTGADRVRLEAIRDDVRAGLVDLGELEANVRAIALRSTPTCPACGSRPQTRETTGLCEPCHLRALAQAHRNDQATREAKRELWRARQESSRAKRARRSDEDEDE